MNNRKLTTESFDKKYIEKGGFGKLSEMRALKCSTKLIGNAFGVHRQTVKDWMVNLFGEPYDPRAERRELIISSMVEFAATHDVQEFWNTHRGRNKLWVEEALKRCKEKGIYNS